MTRKLKPPSYAMMWALKEIGLDWTEIHTDWPTLEALERRGLIETRMERLITKKARLTMAGANLRGKTNG